MLFEPFKKQSLQLKNRIVMAPMTRARNPDKGVPTSMNAEYYRQRSGAGLIITEGAAISETSVGVLRIPGLHTAEQTEGWKLVTQAIHGEGSMVFAQLWHVGRISHVSNQPNRQLPVGPSDIRAVTSFSWGYDEDGNENFVSCSQPRPLSSQEIKQVEVDFAQASSNAIKAGFDGIELHGANGYLIEQFLNPFINNRVDQYGGTIENRCRFLLETVDTCAEKIGYERVAVRLSPYGGLHDSPHYEEIEPLYYYLTQELAKRNIAYIHIMDQKSRGSYALPEGFLARFRSWYSGIIILAGGLDREKSEELLVEGNIDLAAFGEPFIANPDLTERLKHHWPLAQPDRSTFYGGAEQGYTDYPCFDTEKELLVR